MHEFLKNQTSPRFSLTCFAQRKTRRILIYNKNRAETSRSDIIFPLGTIYMNSTYDDIVLTGVLENFVIRHIF